MTRSMFDGWKGWDFLEDKTKNAAAEIVQSINAGRRFNDYYIAMNFINVYNEAGTEVTDRILGCDNISFDVHESLENCLRAGYVVKEDNNYKITGSGRSEFEYLYKKFNKINMLDA